MLEKLLQDYEFSHSNKVNRAIHKICVPLITYSLLGLCWNLEKNFCFAFIAGAFYYYSKLSFKLSLYMLLFIIPILPVFLWIEKNSSLSLFSLSLWIFSLSWVFQFIGHHIEGKKPSFLKDLQFFLIGPVWTLSFLINKRYWMPCKSLPDGQNQNS